MWVRIVIPITLDTHPHVLPGVGDAAAGAMDEALGWSGCSTYRPQIALAPHFFYFEIIAFYLRIKEEAERVGFEPTRRLNTAYAISSPNSYGLACPRVSGNWAYLSDFRRFLGSRFSVLFGSVLARLQYDCSKLRGSNRSPHNAKGGASCHRHSGDRS